jgi:hypothetical protein
MKDGHLNTCKICHNKISKKYREDNPKECAAAKKRCYERKPEVYKAKAKEWRKSHLESRKEEFKKYKEKYPEKVAAHVAVMVEVRSGQMCPPDYCEGCFGSAPLEAHHPDYSKPLNVEWLCKKCHTEIHRKVVK